PRLPTTDAPPSCRNPPTHRRRARHRGADRRRDAGATGPRPGRPPVAALAQAQPAPRRARERGRALERDSPLLLAGRPALAADLAPPGPRARRPAGARGQDHRAPSGAGEAGAPPRAPEGGAPDPLAAVGRDLRVEPARHDDDDPQLARVL